MWCAVIGKPGSARLEGTSAIHVSIVVCACSRHALDFKILIFRSFVTHVTKGLVRGYFTYEKVKTTG